MNPNDYARASLAVDRIRDDLGESRVRQGRDHDVLEACRWSVKLLTEVDRSYYEGRDDGVAKMAIELQRALRIEGGSWPELIAKVGQLSGTGWEVGDD